MECKNSAIATLGPTYYVGDDGIYSRVQKTRDVYQCVMSKEVFVEAYNKWIKGENDD